MTPLALLALIVVGIIYFLFAVALALVFFFIVILFFLTQDCTGPDKNGPD
jgi:hypothetical protein